MEGSGKYLSSRPDTANDGHDQAAVYEDGEYLNGEHGEKVPNSHQVTGETSYTKIQKEN